MKLKRYCLRLGLPLFLLGCVMIVVGYPTGMNNRNWYLLLSLLAVVAGTVLYVAKQKKDSKY